MVRERIGGSGGTSGQVPCTSPEGALRTRYARSFELLKGKVTSKAAGAKAAWIKAGGASTSAGPGARLEM